MAERERLLGILRENQCATDAAIEKIVDVLLANKAKGLLCKENGSPKKIIKWELDTGFADCKQCGEIEVDANTTEDEIDAIVKEETFNHLQWCWWDKDDEENIDEE